MNAKNQYSAAADVLRILSILAVIFIHTTTRTLEVSSFALQKIPFTLFLNQIFRFAVPLFFIISGFVLELNYHKNESYITYFKKRLNRIFIPYVFWSAIYYFFVYTNHTESFFRSLIMGDSSYQLYFIPPLLIFYLFFPLIHKYIKIIGNKWVMFFLLIIQLLLLYFDYYQNSLSLFYPITVALLNYFAFILGIWSARHKDLLIHFINKWKPVLFFGAITFAYYIFYEGFTGYLKTHNYLTFYSTWRPSVFIYTILIGCFLYWVFDRNFFNNSLIKILSRLSFFVFFIHVIVLEALWYILGIKVFQVEFAKNFWWDPFYFTLVTLISFSIAYIVHKIPYFSKITG